MQPINALQGFRPVAGSPELVVAGFGQRTVVTQAQDAITFSHDPVDEETRLKRVKNFATTFTPRREAGYVVNNAFFQPYTTPPSASQLSALRKQLAEFGTFALKLNPATGLVQTSETENKEMLRQWFTDSCMVGYWQRQTHPDLWRKNMITNAAALNTEAAKVAVRETVKNPDWYRKGDVMQGVFHIYMPETVTLDTEGIPNAKAIALDKSWFNQKRLESQGLMLFWLARTVRAGNTGKQKQPWGFTPQDLHGKQGEFITQAITDMARYVVAANTNPKTKTFDFRTPSSSSWEEAPFAEGMTWDAATCVLGAQQLYQLLYKDPKTPELKALRKHVKQYAPELTPKHLKQFIQDGRRFINTRVVNTLLRKQAPIQTPKRPYDTSLALLAASDYVFDRYRPLQDAKARLALVQANKTALLGDYGMRRYNAFTLDGVALHDSYLNKVYPFSEAIRMRELKITADKPTERAFGSTDASDLASLQARQKLSSPETAAQWGIGLSASLQALAKVKDTLLDVEKRHGKSKETTTLLATTDAELMDVVNRCIAAIPGGKDNELLTRADGTPLPPHKPMEAWETTVNEAGQLTWVPGQHTLPWHAAQLFDGLHAYEQVQRKAGKIP